MDYNYKCDKNNMKNGIGEIVNLILKDYENGRDIDNMDIYSQPDRDAVKQRILANTQKFGIGLDYSDDSYVTLDGDEGYIECHSHPEIVQCFPANTLKMNEDFKKKLLNGYQKCV